LSINYQCHLFKTISPLFKSRPTLIALNKSDVVSLSSLYASYLSNPGTDAEPSHDAVSWRAISQLLDTSVVVAAAEGRTVEAKKLTGLGIEGDEGEGGLYPHVETSCAQLTGVQVLKNTACKLLMDFRVEQKKEVLARKAANMASGSGAGSGPVEGKAASVLNRLHVAVPKRRDERDRPAFIPPGARTVNGPLEAVKPFIWSSEDKDKDGEEGMAVFGDGSMEVGKRKKYDMNDPQRRRLLRDEEVEGGGAGGFLFLLPSFLLLSSHLDIDLTLAGVFNINLRRSYLLTRDEWKDDVVPEIMDGKNVADFYSLDIRERLEELEREERRMLEEGAYDEEGMVSWLSILLFKCPSTNAYLPFFFFSFLGG
jgi:hypothetical protein